MGNLFLRSGPRYLWAHRNTTKYDAQPRDQLPSRRRKHVRKRIRSHTHLCPPEFLARPTCIRPLHKNMFKIIFSWNGNSVRHTQTLPRGRLLVGNGSNFKEGTERPCGSHRAQVHAANNLSRRCRILRPARKALPARTSSPGVLRRALRRWSPINRNVSRNAQTRHSAPSILVGWEFRESGHGAAKGERDEIC
jgi:hypothetical protein